MIKKFDEVFVDKTRLGKKIPKEEYKKKGKYIIIDQGKDKIAGFTDNEDGIFTDVPTIIFGDHTRIIKYIDKPFFLGADGVKVLKSKINNANYKYLYYALKAAYIPNTGYNRHFKWLKKVSINYPSFEKQKRIVKLLDNLSEVKNKKNEELKLCDTLIKARFVEMFGDPVKNEKKFLTKQLSQIGKCKNGINFHKSEIGNTVNCLTVKDFENNQVINDTTKLAKIKLSNLPSNDYFLNNGDIVFVRSNGNKSLVGRSVLIFPNNNPTLFSGFCIRFRKDSKRLESVYLLWLLKNESIRMKMRGRGVNIQNLNQQIINNLSIPVPPIELQKEFASFVQQVDKSKVVNASIMKYIISIRFYLYFKENKEGAR